MRAYVKFGPCKTTVKKNQSEKVELKRRGQLRSFFKAIEAPWDECSYPPALLRHLEHRLGIRALKNQGRRQLSNTLSPLTFQTGSTELPF